MTETLETKVAIVGGGPVGLAVALDLGWRGIPCVLVDEGNGVVDQPKLGHVSTRTMEYCRRWGVAEQVYDSYPADYPRTMVFATSLAGFELAREDYPSYGEMEPLDCSPERFQRCTQIFFDPILRRAAEAQASATIRLHCRMTDYAQDADGVTVACEDLQTGEPVTVRADYLVGCDGAASAVRKALGIGMAGHQLSHSVNIFFRAPELWTRHDKGKAERYILIDENGTWGNFTAVDGRELWRLTVIHAENPADMTAFDAPATLRRAFGGDWPAEILSVQPWTRLQLVADGFQAGRVFLAGDAVHCFSPTGGFGANTGVGDAVNLAWKLAAAVEGWAGPHLLETYETERRPMAIRNTREAAANFRRQTSAGKNPNLFEATPEGQRQRAAVGELVRGETQLEWETLGVQLGYRYEGSPIVVPDGTAATPDDTRDYVPTARPGARAPHAWLADGRSTLDLFGKGFVLLRFDPASATERLEAVAETIGVPLTVTDIGEAAVRDLYAAALVLVRPDGHVAWRGGALPGDCTALVRRVSGFG